MTYVFLFSQIFFICNVFFSLFSPPLSRTSLFSHHHFHLSSLPHLLLHHRIHHNLHHHLQIDLRIRTSSPLPVMPPSSESRYSSSQIYKPSNYKEIDEDLELRYPHKGMFKELLKKQGSQNYGLIVVSEINYQRLLFMNLKKKKMVDGGKVQFWGCLCFARMDPTLFCQELVTMCQANGLIFNRDPVVPLSQSNPTHIERELENFNKKCKAILESKQQMLQLLIIIMPDFKVVRTYDKIKRVCETELGIVSQYCQPRQAQKLNKQYLENLALKINVKVGGRNTLLNDAFERRIPLVIANWSM
ncbi:protein argonaute 5-like isoform X2 [Trifolium pratense]|uniref:protein argonaute 5-like isoform X2 n=2 Tax=Trifolium pratense TaxID=57577 RepID=UPI001E69333B|nr:protein argonaute 5-like isoform X2 [Trifolium pratense]XP_045809283.1 protein argonaute 5-like isoform X2 [Trifolium pratense]XP_045809285.1 protein argonaute 5-like isoform X2 [Trifolium pratense]XP_045809287.1 protein argonaute 5-like isoform X2 [Trifolium pratense]XP_045809288.1 protein argonaute 5-like isoform X2 [Trifolium pratense]